MPDENALRPLTPKQRMFIDNMVVHGMDKVEAYCKANDIEMTDDIAKKTKSSAHRTFLLPQVYSYYDSLTKEAIRKAAGKAAWTKDIATEKLLKLVEKAESEVYDEAKPITISRLNAIFLPAKELNTMYQLNTTTTVDFEGRMVQIVGEDKIPD